MYVMKVWNEVVFGKCPSWILKKIATAQYHLYLLCNTDLPWERDELREYPDLISRQRLFKTYKDIVVNQSTPWSIISENNSERLQKAIKIVEQFIKNK